MLNVGWKLFGVDTVVHSRWLLSVVLALTMLGACGNGVSDRVVSKAGTAEPPTFAASAVSSAVPRAMADPNQTARLAEIDLRFKQAAAMLHIKQYQYAATALHRVLQLAPNMPEAHVNMGYAMLGMMHFTAARDSFNEAIKLKPSQANAHYGLALASYNTGDMATAVSALNNYIQLARPDDPYITKARAALSEWRQTAQPKMGVQPATGESISQRGGRQLAGEIKNVK